MAEEGVPQPGVTDHSGSAIDTHKNSEGNGYDSAAHIRGLALSGSLAENSTPVATQDETFALKGRERRHANPATDEDTNVSLAGREEALKVETDNEIRSIVERSSPSTLQIDSQHATDLLQGTKDLPNNDAAYSASLGNRKAELDNSNVQGDVQEHVSAPQSPLQARATSLTASIHRDSLPPAPEPEIRFNFHLFLEQLKHRTADPVARYLRSFLVEFGKKQWAVHEQVRIISDFLAFISGKMIQCEVWRICSDTEFDNAREGMEKLVMNRLYSQTFSPEIPSPGPSSPTDLRGKNRLQKLHSPARRGQHQEDVERDNVLAEKIQIYGWVEEQHLDIVPVTPDGKRFLTLAQQELLKLNNYRAPRDKVICILNACKVIFGFLRSSKATDTSADALMPLLICTVLRAKPQHMVSNIQYIFRFRNQEKLGGEAGYYLSSLMGAVQFIENLDRTTLTISDEDFERNVEKSVAAITERQSQAATANLPRPVITDLPLTLDHAESSSVQSQIVSGIGDSIRPVQGILRNFQKPLASIGRMLSDDPGNAQNAGTTESHDARGTPGDTDPSVDSQALMTQPEASQLRSTPDGQRDIHTDVNVDSIVDTLCSMFPSLDRDVIVDIVIAKQARVGAAVDACLNLTS